MGSSNEMRCCFLIKEIHLGMSNSKETEQNKTEREGGIFKTRQRRESGGREKEDKRVR